MLRTETKTRNAKKFGDKHMWYEKEKKIQKQI